MIIINEDQRIQLLVYFVRAPQKHQEYILISLTILLRGLYIIYYMYLYTINNRENSITLHKQGYEAH